MSESDFNPLLKGRLPKLKSFRRQLDKFLGDVAAKDDVLEAEITEKENDFQMVDSMLSCDLCGIETGIRTAECELMRYKVQLETALNTLAFERRMESEATAECRQLTVERTVAEHRLEERRSGHLTGNSLVIAYSPHFAIDFVLPPNVVDLVFSLLDLRSLIALERVSRSYQSALLSWSGWMHASNRHLYESDEVCDVWLMDGESMSVASSIHSGTALPRFRRFFLTIENRRKRGEFKVEVVGFADSRHSEDSVFDASRRRIMLQPVEGDSKLAKEFSICDVLLQNHQTLAEVNAETQRLKAKLQSDVSVKRGYQLTTTGILQRIEAVDTCVKNLELQQQSDIATIQYLQSEISEMQSQLAELSTAPAQIEAKHAAAQRQLEEELAALDLVSESDDSGLRQELDTLYKERQLLAKEIEVQQSRYRQVTLDRDSLQRRWHFLKGEISKHNA